MRMERNIYHRKDGRFEGRYPNGHSANGKTKYCSVFGKTYDECKKKLKDAKASQENKMSLSELTITQAVTYYIESAKYQLKPSTLGIYKRYLDSYISPGV